MGLGTKEVHTKGRISYAVPDHPAHNTMGMISTMPVTQSKATTILHRSSSHALPRLSASCSTDFCMMLCLMDSLTPCALSSTTRSLGEPSSVMKTWSERGRHGGEGKW